MVWVFETDSVVAIVLHSISADAAFVMVDRAMRKGDDALLPAAVDTSVQEMKRVAFVTWDNISKEKMKSKGTIRAELEQVDIGQGVAALKKSWHTAGSVHGV